MNGPSDLARAAGALAGSGRPWPLTNRQRPTFRWSDFWRAPLHDFPIRDEILYQFLPLSPDMEVLEIGPGGGFTAFRLARQVRRLTLVDVAEQNILCLKLALRNGKNIDLFCADVCDPSFPAIVSARFDAVFGLEVFELVPDPGACLKNLAAVLRKGGLLLLQFPNYPPPRSPGMTHFRSRAELDSLLTGAGFESWEVYSLKLRPFADFIFREFHERPLKLYRRLRQWKGPECPLVYEDSWAFHHRRSLRKYRYPLHGAWQALFALLRLGGDCFDCRALGKDILNHNLLLLARR